MSLIFHSIPSFFCIQKKYKLWEIDNKKFCFGNFTFNSTLYFVTTSYIFNDVLRFIIIFHSSTKKCWDFKIVICKFINTEDRNFGTKIIRKIWSFTPISICTPLVVRLTSRRLSISLHLLCVMCGITVSIAAMIRRFRWLIPIMFSLNTVFLMYSQKKWSCVRSGHRAGHEIEPSSPIHHELGNFSFKVSRTDTENEEHRHLVSGGKTYIVSQHLIKKLYPYVYEWFFISLHNSSILLRWPCI